MTRKRYTKLLMAKGYSRNVANACAREIIEEGGSYRLEYDNLLEAEKFMGITNRAEMEEAVRRVTEAIAEEIPVVMEKVAKIVEAVGAGAEAFMKAFSEKMRQEGSA